MDPLENQSSNDPEKHTPIFNNYMDAFFKELPHQDNDSMPDTKSTDVAASKDCVSIFSKHLNKLLFVCVEANCGQLKVYIRQYKRNENNHLIRTRHEVSMSLLTWYDFFKKIDGLNLVYRTSSYIANNQILVMSCKSEIRIKMLYTTRFLKLQLDECQMQILKNSVSDINDSIIRYMYTNFLSQIIIEEQRCVMKCLKSDNNLLSHLMLCIEHDLIRVFKTVFECEGCKNTEVCPLNHECFTLTNVEKYNRLGSNTLMLCDIPKIVSNFLNHVDFVTYSFLNSIDVHTFSSVLFKSF